MKHASFARTYRFFMGYVFEYPYRELLYIDQTQDRCSQKSFDNNTIFNVKQKRVTRKVFIIPIRYNIWLLFFI